VAYALLSGKAGISLKVPAIRLKDAGDHFPEWVRFCSSIQDNGNFSLQLEDLLQQILSMLEKLTDEVQQKSNGYPKNSTTGEVWFSGAIIRNWCETLAFLFDKRQDLKGKVQALQFKCKVTLSIMSHYPAIVGPDMIEAALALEAIGDYDNAKSYYRAVIADLQPLADELSLSPEEPLNEHDKVMLEALLRAYKELDRSDETHESGEARERLRRMIYR